LYTSISAKQLNEANQTKKKHEKGEKNVTLYNLTVNKNTKKLFKATKFTPKRNENPQKN